MNISSSVKLDVYKILSETIEKSVHYGYNRAHKHTENPSKDHIVETIHAAVMHDLCEIIKFDE